MTLWTRLQSLDLETVLQQFVLLEYLHEAKQSGNTTGIVKLLDKECRGIRVPQF